MIKLSKWANLSLIFIGIYILVVVLREFSSILRPLAIAFLISILLVPSFDPKIKKRKMAWILPVIVILLLVVIILAILNPLRAEVADLDEDYVELSEIDVNSSQIIVSPNSSITVGAFENFLSMNSEQFSGIYFKVLDYSFKFLSDFLTESLILILFLVFLISAYPRTIRPFIESKEKYLEAFIDLEKSVKNYLVAKGVLSLITAIISFLIMWAFDVDFRILLAVGIFLLNFIPTFGSIVAVAIVIVAQYFSGGFGVGLLSLAILMALIQLIIGNYLDPKYVGKKLNLPPLLVLFSLLFWGLVWGIPGMFFSVPLTSVVLILTKHFSGLQK